MSIQPDTTAWYGLLFGACISKFPVLAVAIFVQKIKYIDNEEKIFFKVETHTHVAASDFTLDNIFFGYNSVWPSI